ncbi:MAG: hypothetical protein GEU90_16800 [Gemmatimonas sp.]|nr:hypothetical protein [Gemmatimonas sp.]
MEKLDDCQRGTHPPGASLAARRFHHRCHVSRFARGRASAIGELGARPPTLADQLQQDQVPPIGAPVTGIGPATIGQGAFTGALRSAPGLLTEANNGTLFLDEIGSLGLPEQAKLLRAIELGVFRSVGATRDSRSTFRLISATSENLRHLAADGRFRDDLRYRLRGAVITVPPLRDRREDIRPLVRLFLHRVSCPKEITGDAMQLLDHYPWPGNVRELRHVIEGAAALSQGPAISRYDLLEVLDQSSIPSKGRSRTDAARAELQTLLEDCEWDTARAAQKLGVHRVTVYRRMKRAGILPPLRSNLY